MATKLHTELKATDPPLLQPGMSIQHYTITKMLSIGGFGQVYSAYDQFTNHKVAVKVESEEATIPLLKNEATCLQHLNQHHNPYGSNSREPILQYLAYGRAHSVRYLVMDHSGPNLRELKKATKNDQFSIGTSLWIMDKMVTALKIVHSLGWLHRDVKPANFCIGGSDMRQLYLIDFGMCRYYLSPDGTPKPRKLFSAFHGTVRYASMNTHNRQDMSRWDDLWSVFYIAVENMVGALPWRFEADRDKVSEMKNECDLLSLKFGNESSAPACLHFLQRLLTNAFNAPESFYVPPCYSQIMQQLAQDLSLRAITCATPMDWHKQSPPPVVPQHIQNTATNYENRTYKQVSVPQAVAPYGDWTPQPVLTDTSNTVAQHNAVSNNHQQQMHPDNGILEDDPLNSNCERSYYFL